MKNLSWQSLKFYHLFDYIATYRTKRVFTALIVFMFINIGMDELLNFVAIEFSPRHSISGMIKCKDYHLCSKIGLLFHI